MTSATETLPRIEEISDLARLLRRLSLTSTTAAGSGHPTSSLSAADLVAVLLARHFSFDPTQPGRPDNDRFVLSKGHAAPLLYAALAAFGLIEAADLDRLRQDGSPLEGHPVPGLPLVDVATGSLGQGLSNGLGMAIGQRLAGGGGRTWVLLGDSEVAEGSVWEAMELAGHRGMDNLTAVIDLNRLGQRGETMHGWNAEVHRLRAEALGWTVTEVEGHDHRALDEAFASAGEEVRPLLVIARTVKGKGVSFLEDAPGHHGKALSEDEMRHALEELGEPDREQWVLPAGPPGRSPEWPAGQTAGPVPSYEDATSTRDAFGAALARQMESNARLVVLDAEVSDSTRTAAAGEASPDRFIQTYIAEQNMLGMAVGLQAVGWKPLAATFGAFLTRAHDFIRMGQIGHADLCLVGSHAGVSIGEDGPSQMALDDISMMRGLDAVVLYPADAYATWSLLDLAIRHDGLSYLRTTRGATPLLYDADAPFTIGGSHLHGQGPEDVATIVAAGVTLFEALEAKEQLAREGLATRVVDLYCVQPPDVDTLAACATETGLVVTVEDHRGPGGIGEAVATVLAESASSARLSRLAVWGMPGSAEPETQRSNAGIDAVSICEAVRSAVYPARRGPGPAHDDERVRKETT